MLPRMRHNDRVLRHLSVDVRLIVLILTRTGLIIPARMSRSFAVTYWTGGAHSVN